MPRCGGSADDWAADQRAFPTCLEQRYEEMTFEVHGGKLWIVVK